MTARALQLAIVISALAAGALPPHGGSDLLAQGVTTAAIRGTVTAADDAGVDEARVEVLNSATGFAVESVVRQGRFLVQGLEVGGPYTVTVERPGSLPARREAVFLTLGEPLELVFQLQPAPIVVDTLRVAVPSLPRIHAQGGPATTISDSLIHRLSTLNRNFHDFMVLAPQVSTKIGRQRSGVSGAGANLRFNSFLINGAEERLVNGSVSAASNLGKSIPIDAVKEYQVLVAPYDVRYGDFAGALSIPSRNPEPMSSRAPHSRSGATTGWDGEARWPPASRTSDCSTASRSAGRFCGIACTSSSLRSSSTSARRRRGPTWVSRRPPRRPCRSPRKTWRGWSRSCAATA